VSDAIHGDCIHQRRLRCNRAPYFSISYGLLLFSILWRTSTLEVRDTPQ
jgi:hypothetical protein